MSPWIFFLPPHRHGCADACPLMGNTKNKESSHYFWLAPSLETMFVTIISEHNYYTLCDKARFHHRRCALVSIYWNGSPLPHPNLMICTRLIGVTQFRCIDCLCAADWSVLSHSSIRPWLCATFRPRKTEATLFSSRDNAWVIRFACAGIWCFFSLMPRHQRFPS